MHVPHIRDLEIDACVIAVELDGVSTDLFRLAVLEGLVVVPVSLPVDDGDHLVHVERPAHSVVPLSTCTELRNCALRTCRSWNKLSRNVLRQSHTSSPCIPRWQSPTVSGAVEMVLWRCTANKL